VLPNKKGGAQNAPPSKNNFPRLFYWPEPSAVGACVTSNKRVPLSRCTFFPGALMTDTCALFELVVFSRSPSIPKTPRWFAASCDEELASPSIPGFDPLVPALGYALVLPRLPMLELLPFMPGLLVGAPARGALSKSEAFDDWEDVPAGAAKA
jgi:hypothetical protein